MGKWAAVGAKWVQPGCLGGEPLPALLSLGCGCSRDWLNLLNAWLCWLGICAPACQPCQLLTHSHTVGLPPWIWGKETLTGQGSSMELIEIHPDSAELSQVLSCNHQSWGWSQMEVQVAKYLGAEGPREGHRTRTPEVLHVTWMGSPEDNSLELPWNFLCRVPGLGLQILTPRLA